jgi:hypothetical protein
MSRIGEPEPLGPYRKMRENRLVKCCLSIDFVLSVAFGQIGQRQMSRGKGIVERKLHNYLYEHPSTKNEGWKRLRDIAWEIGMGDTRASHVSLRRAAKSLAKKGLLQIQTFRLHIEKEGRYRWLLAVRFRPELD